MFPRLTSSFSLGRILSGISKTLSIANKAIPIYQQLKPAISNMPTLIKTVKSITATPKNNKIQTSNINNNQTKKIISNSNSTNNPVFFR